MNNKLKTLQDRYFVAKAMYDMLYGSLRSREATFVKDSGFVDKNGNVPKYIWAITDRKLFGKLNKKFCKENAELIGEVDAASKLLRDSERELIEYALAIPGIPNEVRETLRGHRNEYGIYEKLLSLATRVDWTTVPAGECA